MFEPRTASNNVSKPANPSICYLPEPLPPPKLRLLLDENLSPRIARALHELGHHVEAVHDVPQLGASKGVSDSAVLDRARSRNQVIASINVDMVMICIEAGEPVIWIDPQRKDSLKYNEMVVHFFLGVPRWERLIGPEVVIRSLKTKDQPLSFADSRALVERRLTRQRQAVGRRSRPKPSSHPKLAGGL